MKIHSDLLPRPGRSIPSIVRENIRRSRGGLLFVCAAAILGTLDALLLLGGAQIDPRHMTLLKGDPAVYQAGWEFLRRQAWLFPPTWLSQLDYPFGISAAYLDVIPIIAIPLHLIAGFLPQDFQYFGLYLVLCLILQGYFGFRLLACFLPDKLTVLLGGLFFLNAPILDNRLYGHYSLSSQWLILAGFYYYFRRSGYTSRSGYLWPFAVIAAVAAGIHPYLVVMVLFIGFAAVLRTVLERAADHAESGALARNGLGPHAHRFRSYVAPVMESPLVWILLMAGAALLSLLFFGFVVPHAGPEVEGAGYTAYSMNLLAPLNPGGASLILPSYAVFPMQRFEGYNYLGLGVIGLGIVCLARRPARLADLLRPSTLPLVLVSLLLTLLSLSTKITFGTSVILDVKLPEFLLHPIAVFRSSGRFFWPAHYLVSLACIVGVAATLRARWSKRLVIGLALLVQFADLMPLRSAVAVQARIPVTDPLKSAAWTKISHVRKHLVVLPAWQCNQIQTPGGTEGWPWLARLAATNGLTLNSVHAARASAASDALNCISLPQAVARGALRPDTAYVLSDRLVLDTIERQRGTHYCRRVDSFNLCSFDPGRASLSRLLSDQILPPYTCGTVFQADRLPPKSIVMSGWDLRPFPAIWTLGRNPTVDVRPALPPDGDMRLEMEFGGPGALLTPRHPLQRAIVSVNGHQIGTMTFAFRGNNRRRSMVIPKQLVRSGQMIEIGLDLPDAAAPRDLGINGDGRILGLYVSRLWLACGQ